MLNGLLAVVLLLGAARPADTLLKILHDVFADSVQFHHVYASAERFSSISADRRVGRQ
jgi:hypothetical protein